MTNNERQRAFAERQKQLGRKQKIFWLTHDEWAKMKEFLKHVLRGEK